MSTFSRFYEDLTEFVNDFEKKNQTVFKVQADEDSNTIIIRGENSDAIQNARLALDNLSEFVYTTAEHHPYWALAFNSIQILKTVLEEWEGKLTSQQLEEINWFAREITNNADKIRHSK